MFRAARNITLLLIVCFIASGIPLYADTFDFNISLGATSKNNLSLDVQLNQVTGSQWDFNIVFSTDGKPLPITLNPTRPFVIGLYHDELHIKDLDLYEMANDLPDFSTELLVEDSLVIQFSINQDEIDLPDGDYRLEIKPIMRDSDLLIPPHNVAINFENDLHYIPALQSINRNETALLLYFPDQQYNHLIPITRVIPYTTTPLRATLNNLQMGPIEELGLPTGSPIPATSGLRLSRGIAGVYLPTDVGSYGNSSASTYISVNSFVSSLTSINEVNGVQFYFGGRIRETGFHDVVMNEPHYPSTNAKIYVGTNTGNNRTLLTPISLNESNPSIDLIFNQLKFKGNTNLYRYGVKPPIPLAVELMSHTLKDGVLTLELNKSFLEVYPNSDSKKAFMLEAMVYSFTSIENVESIIFQVNGEPITSYGGLQLHNPVVPSRHINPEK